MKKKGDVKFIIYQALYMFVVCVVAIKGASLDLTQVVNDDGKPKVTLSPDSLEKLLEIIRRSIIVDTNLYVIILKADLDKMDDKIKQLVVQNPQLQVTSTPLNTNISMEQVRPKEEKQPEERKDPSQMQEIRI